MSIIEANVIRTSYSTNGKAMIAEYALTYDRITHYLYLGSNMRSWWERRTSITMPFTIDECLDHAIRGRLRPTQLVRYTRDGRWPKVVDTVVTDWPRSVVETIRLAKEIEPDIEVVRVMM